MAEEDRDRRSESLKKRLEGPGKEEKGEGKKEEPGTVKDRPTVLMYLPEEVYLELDASFDEINAKYKREKGEKLGKNRDYYPAVIKAGLEGKDVRDILDI